MSSYYAKVTLMKESIRSRLGDGLSPGTVSVFPLCHFKIVLRVLLCYFILKEESVVPDVTEKKRNDHPKLTILSVNIVEIAPF